MVLSKDIRVGTVTTHNGEVIGTVIKVWKRDNIIQALLEDPLGNVTTWAIGSDIEPLSNWYQPGEEILTPENHPDPCHFCNFLQQKREKWESTQP